MSDSAKNTANMSGYRGRSAPNISRYLHELNMSTGEAPTEDAMTFDDDLALFTNTQFFDYDSGQNTDYQAPPPKPDSEVSRNTEEPASTSAMSDFSNLEFMSGWCPIFFVYS